MLLVGSIPSACDDSNTYHFKSNRDNQIIVERKGDNENRTEEMKDRAADGEKRSIDNGTEVHHFEY